MVSIFSRNNVVWGAVTFKKIEISPNEYTFLDS